MTTRAFLPRTSASDDAGEHHDDDDEDGRRKREPTDRRPDAVDRVDGENKTGAERPFDGDKTAALCSDSRS